MPTYLYECENGHVLSVFQHDMKPTETKKCEICKKISRRAYYLEKKNTDLVSNERYSIAMGVSPEQIEEAKRTFPGSEYDKKGRLLIKNRKHKLAEMKRRGYIEYD